MSLLHTWACCWMVLRHPALGDIYICSVITTATVVALSESRMTAFLSDNLISEELAVNIKATDNGSTNYHPTIDHKRGLSASHRVV